MGNGKIINLGFILIIIISLFISFGCQSDEDDVNIAYEVTGTAMTVDITYSDSEGRIAQAPGQIPPWVDIISFNVSSDEVSGFLVFLMAQNVDVAALSTDTITVTIKKDGLIFSQDNGVGATIVVSTSGNL